MQKLIYFKRIGIEIDPLLLGSVEANLYQRLNDFIVEEILPNGMCNTRVENLQQHFDLSKKYIHATLVKRGISTIDACSIIAQKNNLDVDDITYCGLKDTFGFTAQRICIPNKGKLKRTRFSRLFLKEFKGSNKRLKARDNKGNHFVVKVRRIFDHSNKLTELLNNFQGTIPQILPNFYGPQRFGQRQNNHILGKLLLKKKYKKFIVRFLTDTNSNEAERIQKVRHKIKKNMGDWYKCKKILQQIKNLNDEKQLINNLITMKNEVAAIRKIEISHLYIHSVSSYLFNQALSQYIKENKKTRNITIEKIGANTKFNKINSSLYLPIMKKEQIKLSDFDTPYREFCVHGHPRKAFFCPKNLNIQADPKNIILSFDLATGEYASLFLDFIFNSRSGIKLN